ncbi:antibiotic biosynthesis monooxygenase family protein [Roseospira goensis]|uniref:Heme-degrading monooxygenase HmoA n=1 Tax=Roseospira goensis TaxID=391922 RepID=A0A7W6RYX2_9PROT|nr:antibiotic biosynthesis monooxygenase family protein [Roseospira goensis]MBB4285697.1 heme-degrading monooxygenase HmoA [Roseospira goensis]
MMMVIDFLETEDRTRAKETWCAVSGFLSQRPGFRDGQLVETFQTVQARADYALASICQWDSEADWDAARAAAKATPAVTTVLGGSGTRFTSLKTELVDGRPYVYQTASPHLVLLDVIYLQPGQADAYAAMWHEAADFMGTQPGFVNASLFRNRNTDDAIAFVNIAEWDSPRPFFDAVHTDRFNEIVAPFKEDFSLFLTTRTAYRSRNAASLLMGDAA